MANKKAAKKTVTKKTVTTAKKSAKGIVSRACGKCGIKGHNVRTCTGAAKSS